MPFVHNMFDFEYVDLLCETKTSGRTYETPVGTKFPSITTVLGILSRDAIQPGVTVLAMMLPTRSLLRLLAAEH